MMQEGRRCATKKPTGKRKASYLLRKDELQAERSQLEDLRREVRSLKVRAGQPPVSPRGQQLELWYALSNQSILAEAIRDQQLALAGGQSRAAEFQESRPSNPLYTHIHLPIAWDERREALLGLKADMFTRGCQYVAARSQPLDLLKSHFSDHRYEDAAGNLCGERFEFIHFVGVQSLRQVFDAVKFFMTNIEINISERLGHTTVREDYNDMDEATSIPNCRLVSEANDGVTFEMNSAAFAEYFEHREEFGGSPCAVMVADSVDVDDLYPYNPSERVRRDVSVAIVFREVKRRRSTGNAAESDEEELVVVMQRAAFSKVYCSELEVADSSAMDAHQEGLSNWGDVMVQTIRGFIRAV